jgi:hypothetical protein
MTDTATAVDTPVPDANVPAPEIQDVETTAESSTAATDPGDERNGYVKKINKLTYHRREAEREAAYWREQALRNQAPQQQAAPEAPQPAAKTLEDFNFDTTAFQQYVFAEAARLAEKAGETAAERKFREQADAEQSSKRQTSWKAKVKTFASETEDFEEVAYTAPISNEVAGLIQAMDDGPAVAYYLGKNPDEAERISQLPKELAAIALGGHQTRLSYERKAADQARKKVSSAPPPPAKIDAVEAAVEKDPSTMSDAEFAKWRRRQIAQRR